jgi:hypothetical protein
MKLDKAAHFGKGSFGYLGKVLNNNTQKIRVLLNYEARKEVPNQQKNVSRTQLGCYSFFFLQCTLHQ